MSKFKDGFWHLAFVVGELKEGEAEPITNGPKKKGSPTNPAPRILKV